VACCRQEERGTSAAGTYGWGRQQREARGEGKARTARGAAAGGRTRGERMSGEEDGASSVFYSLGHSTSEEGFELGLPQ